MVNKKTNQEVLMWASCFLQEKQPAFSLEDCQWYSRQLLLALTKWTMSQLLLNLQQVSVVEEEQLLPLLERLVAFEPLQYIKGEAEFYGRNFHVTPATLIPRPETEEVVEQCLLFLASVEEGTVLEIGVGSGCIIETLALEAPQHQYIGVDLSPEALAVATMNKQRYQLEQVQLVQSDVWQQVPHKKYQAIISNPPYIDESELADMDESVLWFEPHLALFAEEEGLAIYRKIAEQLEEYLAEDGQAFFEIGFRQGESVKRLLEQYCPERKVEVKQDLAGMDRMVIVGKKESVA